MSEIDEKRKKRYRDVGLTILWVALVICVIVFLLYRFDTIWAGIQAVFEVLTPFVIGIGLCYLVNPLYNRIVAFAEEKTGNRKLGKTSASVVCVVVVLLLIYGVSALLMPKLVESVKNLYEKTPEMAANFMNWYSSLAEEEEFPFKNQIIDMIQQAVDYGNDFVSNTVTPNLNVIVTKLYDSVAAVASFLYNFIIGIVAMVYLLNYKDKLIPAAKRMVYSLIPKQADSFCVKVKRFNEIFGGFIVGKILDSLIIGILCFIGMSILKMPYALLISVIVGVTNVIPFFGPLIGAIPGAFIIMIISPEKGIVFIIFVFILQQLDGNYIGPKILGDSIGISSISVLFAIVVGGGLFGFAGMLLAVPTWAFIKYLANEEAEKRLEKAGLPTDVESYGEGMHPVSALPEEDDVSVSVSVISAIETEDGTEKQIRKEREIRVNKADNGSLTEQSGGDVKKEAGETPENGSKEEQ